MRRTPARLHQARPARGGAARHGAGHSSLNHYDLFGQIAGAGFASGDRIVAGIWHVSPIGSFADIMWATPDGERVLLSSRPEAERFITAVYAFDRTEVVAVDARADEGSVSIRAGSVEMDLVAGPGWRIPRMRPLWFTRWVEGPVARAAMGVHTFGVSPTGVHEWYQARVWRPVVSGRATIDGRDLGAIRPVDPPLGVGFTDPPPRPAVVTVRPVLADPDGGLDEVLGARRRR